MCIENLYNNENLRNHLKNTSFSDQIITLPDVIFGKSRDHSWLNPFIKSHLNKPFAPQYIEQAAYFKVNHYDDLTECLSLAYKHEFTLIPRGKGQGIVTGAYNFSGGLILDISKMNKILDFDSFKGTITCECGATISEIRKVCLNMGWDLRQYPTCNKYDFTIAGFLQTESYGLGSIEYGSISSFGNIIKMKIMMVDEDAKIVDLDGVNDYELILGILKSLGTSAFILQVTLALAPSQQWVDMGISFDDDQNAFKLINEVLKSPTFFKHELALFPSSLITWSFNNGENQNSYNFLKNKIPLRFLGNEFSPSKTETLVLLQTNSSCLPFINYHVKKLSGHTFHFEYNRDGYGTFDSITWQQLTSRMNTYLKKNKFSSFKFNFGSFSNFKDQINNKINLINQIISNYNQIDVEALNDFDKSLSQNPSWYFDFIKSDEDGLFQIIGQVFFLIQTDDPAKLYDQINNIFSQLLVLQERNFFGDLENQQAFHPDNIFCESKPYLKDLRRKAKEKFDPKGLLNPRIPFIENLNDQS